MNAGAAPEKEWKEGKSGITEAKNQDQTVDCRVWLSEVVPQTGKDNFWGPPDRKEIAKNTGGGNHRTTRGKGAGGGFVGLR